MKTSNRILLCIFSYRQEHDYSPTVREIGDLTGISSTSTVWNHLNKLSKQKLITYLEKKPRTIKVTERGHKLVHELLNRKMLSQ